MLILYIATSFLSNQFNKNVKKYTKKKKSIDNCNCLVRHQFLDWRGDGGGGKGERNRVIRVTAI